MDQDPSVSIYELAGGEPAFRRLVGRFYELVESDAILRPMYPDDLGPSTEHLTLFLMQYWGGPSTYSQTRGQPRLRGRHMPFPIGAQARDAWVRHMTAALRELDLDPDVERAMLEYFQGAADFMVNQDGVSDRRSLGMPTRRPSS